MTRQTAKDHITAAIAKVLFCEEAAATKLMHQVRQHFNSEQINALAVEILCPKEQKQ